MVFDSHEGFKSIVLSHFWLSLISCVKTDILLWSRDIVQSLPNSKHHVIVHRGFQCLNLSGWQQPSQTGPGSHFANTSRSWAPWVQLVISPTKESSITSNFQVWPPPLPCPLQTIRGREGAASFHHHLPQSNSDKQVFLVSKLWGKEKNKQTTNSGPKATFYHHTPTSHTNHKP